MNITLGSLFDGIGGFPYAGTFLGITPIWASEIEPWPIKVTEKHFPNMKHLGDITKINGAEIEPVDIITFGSPCQDLSVAGKREGLAGERSGLFMDAIRIIRQMRTATGGKCPRFAVWENVPGAFSSNKGEDFRAVLEEIAETEIPMPRSGKWANAGMVRTERVDVAWRVLDAQYWGVPQRRRRIFLVADFGGTSAGEILFIEEGLSRNFAESGKAREEAAAAVGNSVEEPNCLNPWDCQSKRIFPEYGKMATLPAMNGGGANNQAVLISCYGFSNYTPDTVTATQRSCVAKQTDVDLIIEPQLYDMTHADEVMRPVKEGIAPTLNSRMGTGGNQVPVMLAFTQNQRDEVRDLGDKSGALAAEPGMKQQTYVIQNATRGKSQNGLGISQDDVSYTLDSLGNHAVAYPEPANALLGKANLSFRSDTDNIVQQGYAVRRLTPLECLRLQGFPDYWLDIKGMSDTAKYKAIGNSVAIPCVKFVLGGIARVLQI
jgi:DNA (cytosine-5)-methyltransferase 1